MIRPVKRLADALMDRDVEASKRVESEVARYVYLEILLYIAWGLGEVNDLNSLYLLPSKTDIFTENDKTYSYLLSRAKVKLKIILERYKYEEALQSYSELPTNVRMFDIDMECGRIIGLSDDLDCYPNRLEDYLEYVNKPIESTMNKEFANEPKVYYADGLQVELDDTPCGSLRVVPENNRVVENFDVTMDELLAAADVFDETTGNRYRRNILEHHISRIVNNAVTEATSIEFSGVTNIQGQVGAGKSVFSEALTYALTKKGKRVVVLANSVANALKLVDSFREVGINAVPLVGKNREQYIKPCLSKSPCVSGIASEVLTSPCILNSHLVDKNAGLIGVGKEPCTSLKDENETMYICPYYNECPRTSLDREIVSADVVVTTSQGFCYCNYDVAEQKFFGYALNQFDLVICDEVDSLLCVMDEIFAPSAGVNEFVQKASQIVSENLSQKFTEKSVLYNKFNIKITALNSLLTNIKDYADDSKFNAYMLRAFTARRLFYLLKPSDNDQEDNKTDTDTMDARIIEVMNQYLFSSIDVFPDYEQELLNGATLREISPRSELVNALIRLCAMERSEAESIVELVPLCKISFIICVNLFEAVYRDLSEIMEEVFLSDPSLRKLFSRSFSVHQAYMPNSPLGNLLALSMKEEELYIVKHFAYGRLLLLAMPDLVYSENDIPSGPRVLLLSGTGYIPGSYKYHVGDKVDYIIEATEDKREYISNSRIVVCNKQTRVSGAPESKKADALRTLIQESKDVISEALQDGKRALMIVNSYEQCFIAQREINRVIRSLGLDVEAYALKKPTDDIEDVDLLWNRTEIEDFNKKLLIAPISVIARGYNIVDETGNAWFDSVGLLVRPMTDPHDYTLHVQQVNGYIYSKYMDKSCTSEGKSRVDFINDIRKDAWSLMRRLEASNSNALRSLSEEEIRDIVASLFVIIDQLFGRLCRIGSEMKKNFPTLYFIDGAFRASRTNDFDTIDELHRYLHSIMTDSSNPIVAKTLYEPFYKALSRALNKEDNING